MIDHESTQRAMILKDLQNGRCITPYDALKRHDCFRLSSIIFRLRKEGYDIKTRQKKVRSGKIVAEYYLEQKPNKPTVTERIKNKLKGLL